MKNRKDYDLSPINEVMHNALEKLQEEPEPTMSQEEVERLVLEEGLTLEAVINAVITLNGMSVVGLITLAESLSQYVKSKI
jgi:hypothetical protein